MLASGPIEVPTFEREEYHCPFCCSNCLLSFNHEHRTSRPHSAIPGMRLSDWISHADT